MKCNKWLLVYLMFQTLLIISEAGRNSNKRNQKSPLPGLGSGARETSSGRSNSGRGSPTQTNVGGHHVRGASQPNRAPAQPATVGTGRWANTQPRATSPLNRNSVSSALDWSNLRFLGAGSQVRHHHPGSRPLASSHNSRAGPQVRAHYSGTGPSVRPQYSGALASHAPHTQTYPSPGTSRMGHPQHPTNDNFPALGAPKFTYADAEKRSLSLRRSSSSSLGYHSGSKSSLSSVGSIAANPIGLGAPRINAIMQSAAHPKRCVDNTGTMPKVIAPAEHCFDYFKLAVAWNPGFAYKQWVTGYQIRADSVRPSWIIHGLWPTMFQRYKDPMPRCRRNDITFNRNRFINNKMLGLLDNIWYTILAKGWSDNTKLWENEFNKHGSCASRASVIGDDVNYFKRTLELYNQLNIATTLSEGGYKIGATTKLNNIINILENKIGATVGIDYIQHPHTGENYLAELYVCYDTHLKVMDCPNVYFSDEKLETDIRYLDQLPRV